MSTRERPSSAARMGTQDVRASNLASVLTAVTGHPTPPSRAEIAHRTGLTRATVSRLTDSLLQAGVIAELDLPAGGSPGRPGTPLGMRPGSVIAVGLEANVSYLAAVAMDLSGTVLAQDVQTGDFRDSAPAPVLRRLGRMGLAMAERLRPDAVHDAGTALALPGIISDGTLIQAPNLGWRDLRPRPLVDPEGSLGDIRLGNEATFASWSEARKRPGVPDGPASFLYVSGDVGVGGSIVSRSRPAIGEHGWAGEIGHMCVDPQGPVCSCGAKGCLEAFVGHRALATALHVPDSTPTPGILDRLRAGGSKDVLATAAGALGRAVAGAVNLLDISDVVLGGDLAVLLPVLESGVRAELEQRVLAPNPVALVPSVEASDHLAAARGAAISALEPVMEDPAQYLGL